jgi:transcriptional regulator with XRE-family HTH domain
MGQYANLTAGLRDVVQRMGLTQAEAATRCGMSQPRMNQILNGKVEPKIGTCLRIAKGLGAPLEELFREA